MRIAIMMSFALLLCAPCSGFAEEPASIPTADDTTDAAALDDSLTAAEDDAADTETQPIAVELADGIRLLNEQIADQQQLLKTAQSEREQQLIRDHMRLLQKERRSLQSLLHKLVGPSMEALQDAIEERAERRAEEKLKILEERTSQP